MARVKLNLPEKFDFSTEIPVRISDINYGAHVGNDSVLSLIQEARLRFLKQHGFSEGDVDGPGMLMVDAVVVYKSQAFYGDVLRIEVGVDDLDKNGCDLVYRITQITTGREIARAKTGVVFYDYKVGKLVSTPERFKTTFG